MANLVKTTIFHVDASDFIIMNDIYERHMPDPPPARSAPANVVLPRDLLISIDAIVLLSGSSASSPLLRDRIGNALSRLSLRG